MAFALIIFIFLVHFTPSFSISSQDSTITVYYNGTVYAKLYGISKFNIIGDNISRIIVKGTSFILNSSTLYFNNSSKIITVSYRASFPEGVIEINEPFNSSISVLLPSTFTLSYISPEPTSFELSGNLYNVTFYSGGVEILFTPSNVHKETYDLPLIGILFVANDTILGYAIFSLIKTKSKEKKEEEIDLKEEELNERDLAVLDAIKNGASTLQEVIKITKLPKSTAYRRVKKLVKLGYVIEAREEGKVKYILNEKKKRNHE
ncbi:TrmB family transcriptional regulator [Candidatus Acidianus copahuensis]|uniref:TrmB family transcriptional regulator n=2 Tax=Candidatus Acidianus copahuensis TaxID=1160895 RepID=A0A031LSZ9_9CREN|nr:TrmB family transcriptional regulator [Candidatus Acidianus copahuensis]